MSLYGKFYRHLLLPAYETIRGRKMHAHLREADASQWKTRDEIREMQWRELKRLLDHAYQQCPWYRDRFQASNLTPDDVRSPADVAKLAPVTKQDIRDHREHMLAGNHRGRVYEHKTGGSTGAPLQFYVNRGSYEWRLAVSMRGYRWAGCEDGDRQFYVWGAPIGTPPWKQRAKTRLHNAFLRRQIVSSFGFSEPGMADCVERINRFRPITVIGYTNALFLLAQHVLDRNKKLAKPNAVITAAEGVNSLQRTTIERAFGAPVFSSYGSREFMLIAMECEQHNGLHLSADNLYVEVVTEGRPAKEGEAGDILVTDLHNFGMPFLRYRIGDMGVATNRRCSCGRGLPLIERIEGRVLDVIRTPEGRIVPGEFFPHLMKEFNAVKQFQVVQKRLDLLQIRLVLREGANGDTMRGMEREIRRVLGDRIQIHFESVSEIAQTASGKHRVTISELESP